MQQQYMKQTDIKINYHASIDMSSDVYNNLLTTCDLIFKKAIELTYTIMLLSDIRLLPVNKLDQW